MSEELIEIAFNPAYHRKTPYEEFKEAAQKSQYRQFNKLRMPGEGQKMRYSLKYETVVIKGGTKLNGEWRVETPKQWWQQLDSYGLGG